MTISAVETKECAECGATTLCAYVVSDDSYCGAHVCLACVCKAFGVQAPPGPYTPWQTAPAAKPEPEESTWVDGPPMSAELEAALAHSLAQAAKGENAVPFADQAQHARSLGIGGELEDSLARSAKVLRVFDFFAAQKEATRVAEEEDPHARALRLGGALADAVSLAAKEENAVRIVDQPGFQVLHFPEARKDKEARRIVSAVDSTPADLDDPNTTIVWDDKKS